MGDMGEIFRDWGEHKKEKKVQNLESGLKILSEKKIDFKMLSENHVRVGEFDFWPSTGLFIHRASGRKGRGVFVLLKKIHSKQC